MRPPLDIFKKQLGLNIIKVREMLKLDVYNFSKKTNISPNTIKNIENGKVLMRGKTFLKILFFIREKNIKLSVLLDKL